MNTKSWQASVDTLRLILLSFSWLAAILHIILGQWFLYISDLGVLSLFLFFVLTFSRLRLESIAILLILAGVAWLLIDRLPDVDEILNGGRFILVFAALLPTMTLVRATAGKMIPVKESQKRIAVLPANLSSAGFQLAAHFIGSIINTGTFAILSASLPQDSDEHRRKLSAEASLRGMNTSATWSPFFVAFAVGQSLIDKTNSWYAIALGGLTALLFNLVTLPIFTPGINLERTKISLSCLKPISSGLTIVFLSVLGVALIFNLTALSAVVIVMPILVAVHFFLNQEDIREILTNTRGWLLQTADDIFVISIAMLVGFLVTRSGTAPVIISQFHAGPIPGWFALTATPVIMTLASFIGVHPVITSTMLLSLFTGGQAEVHPALLMQGHLIGWAAGTMSSVASLSILTCASLYRVSSHRLAFGPNLWTATLFSLLSGLVLSLANGFLS